MPNPTRALQKVPSAEVLDALANLFPAEEGFSSISLPRIDYVSQDQLEESGSGRTKTVKVVVPAGTFFRNYPEVDDDGKPVLDEDGKQVYGREELGSTVDVQIVYKRHQLKHYDSATNSYVSSPVFDSMDEEIPLFTNRQEIDRGFPADLRAKYMQTNQRTGKEQSSLEDTRVLYVLLDGVLHTLNVRGTSMYALISYMRAVRPSVPAVITHIDSEPKEAGTTKWNVMKPSMLRLATGEEGTQAVETIKELQDSIAARKGGYASERAEVDKKFAAIDGKTK